MTARSHRHRRLLSHLDPHSDTLCAAVRLLRGQKLHHASSGRVPLSASASPVPAGPNLTCHGGAKILAGRSHGGAKLLQRFCPGEVTVVQKFWKSCQRKVARTCLASKDKQVRAKHMHTLLVFPGRTISGFSIPVVRTPHTSFPALLCSDFLKSGWRVSGCVFPTPARFGRIAVPHGVSYRDPCTVSRALTPFSQMSMACAGGRYRPCASIFCTALSSLAWPGRSPVMALAPPCRTGLCW